MDFTEISYGDQPPVDGYAPGAFRVAGELLEGPLLLSAEGLHMWGWLAQNWKSQGSLELVASLHIG